MSPVVFRLTFPCAIDSRQYLLRYVAGTVLGVGRTGGEEKDIGSRGEREETSTSSSEEGVSHYQQR